MAEAFRRRKLIVDSLVGIVKGLPRGYFVRRGPINYNVHSYARNPFACALIMPEFPLVLASDESFMTATVTLELTTLMPDDIDPISTEGFDDSVLDQMSMDAEAILDRLTELRTPAGDPLVMTLWNSAGRGPVCREMSGADWSIQGLEVTFTIDF